MSPSFASLFTPYILITFVLGNPISFPAPLVVSRQQSLYDCLSSHGVPTKLTSSPDFTTLSAPYNLRLAYTPTAITLPTTSQHVSDAVLCAAAAGVKVQAKSGGHSYASFSSGGQDGSLIVDLQEMNSIAVDNVTGIAAVGGGVRLGNLAVAIYNQSQRALPHGSCPGVGVGGHFTHGGYGYASRNWGLALDTIVALDVVLANGSSIHATPTSYPQLYFALRGAADSFGIVTSFYLQTVPAPATTVNFYVGLNSALDSAAIATDAFLKLQDFALNSQYMDRNLTFGIYTDGETFRISGWYFGDQTYFTNTILPALLTGLPTSDSTRINAYSWLDNLRAEAGEELEQPLSGYSKHDTFFAKSITTRESQPLTSAALTSFFDYIITQGRSAADPWFSIINLYGGKDGQINSKDVGSSAYSDRDSLWVFQNYGFTGNSLPPYDSAITTFIDGLNNALTSAQPTGNFGAYLNYVDPSLTPSQAAALYYGTALYSQLVDIKKIVDPSGIFWNPQAIGNMDSATSTVSRASSATSSKPASATPTLTTSTDGTCGATAGTSCLNSGFGNCCSQYGYCGGTSDYCGSGCVAGYGSCDSTTSSSKRFVSTSSTTSTSQLTSTLLPSVDGSCGGTTGRTCLNSPFGSCCSQHGWCGSTAAYCGAGCKAGFGTCTAVRAKPRNHNGKFAGVKVRGPPVPRALVKSPDGTCGTHNGVHTGYTCTGTKWGSCCSKWGFCGDGISYCLRPGCQSDFGSCWLLSVTSESQSSTFSSTSWADSSTSTSINSITSSRTLGSFSTSTSLPASTQTA